MNFHKSQKFTLLGRIPKLADKHTKETGHDKLYPVGGGGAPKTPSWLEYDMKVLCFDGYFHENLADMQQSGSYRIRRVKIAFFLEDETVQVVEPKIINSGIPQGNIVKRQRVTETTSSPENKRFITLLDFNVDKTVTIFDRTYHITNCDASTRRFLTQLGVTVPEPVPVPTDPGHERRQMAERAVQHKNKSSTKNKKFAQFLQNYRKVLLFYGYWDDRASVFGDLRRLVVHYYLADDTIEIKESFLPNSGRHESSGIFLKRMRLPKQICNVPDIGQSTATFAVLNVMGDNFNSGRFIPDSVDSLEKTDYYSYMDLAIGAEINVFGRKVMLTSCDDFTKKFYKDNFGVEEFPDVPLPVGPHDAPAAANDGRLNRKYERQLPPFNGWGTHEDSEGNCKTSRLLPPPIDYDKFVKLDGKMLRFTCKMVTKNIENLERTFIITYYLSNDTIAVFEIPRRNSGFAGGQFLHPQKFFLPDQDLSAPERPKQYTPQHLYIGARLNLNSHIFHIIAADDFALEYMEQNRKQFPFSDINVILQKCRNQFVDKIHYKNLMAKYWNGPGDMDDENDAAATLAPYPADKLRQLLNELLPGAITEHEVLTVCRFFSVENQRKLEDQQQRTPENKALVRNIVQAELQRNLWSDWEALGHYVKHIGAYGETDNGLRDFLSPSKILTVIRGTRLPLNPGQVELMLYVLEKNDVGDISVADFLAFLKRDSSTAITAMGPLSLAINKSCVPSRGTATDHGSSFIDWNKFVESIAV